MEQSGSSNSQESKLMFQSTISEASFMMPRWLQPSAWHQHAPFAFFLTEAMRPKVIAELGTHHGYSFFAFCQAVAAYKLDTQCYAIDTWQGDDHAGFYPEQIFEEVEQHRVENYSAFAHLKRMTFAEALPHFDDKSIDLLHIDGRHFYDDVRQDFLDWLPKLSDNGVVLFHDTQIRERNFGVHQFWEQLAKMRPSFEFHHHCGLGVLSTGSSIPENLQTLFKAHENPAVTKSIRSAYERLGLSIVLMNNLA
jgi:hypothetical protein